MIMITTIIHEVLYYVNSYIVVKTLKVCFYVVELTHKRG